MYYYIPVHRNVHTYLLGLSLKIVHTSLWQTVRVTNSQVYIILHLCTGKENSWTYSHYRTPVVWPMTRFPGPLTTHYPRKHMFFDTSNFFSFFFHSISGLVFDGRFDTCVLIFRSTSFQIFYLHVYSQHLCHIFTFQPQIRECFAIKMKHLLYLRRN